MIEVLRHESRWCRRRFNRVQSLIQQGAVILLMVVPGCLSAVEPVVPGLAQVHRHKPAFAGRVLLGELNCTSCHSGTVEPKGAPILDRVGERIHPDYLEQFIAEPRLTKPGTTMPDVLNHLPEEERRSVARAIADYLIESSSASFSLQAIQRERIEDGRDLFHQVGCVACHSPEDQSLPGSPSLVGIEQKYSLESLTGFLEAPLENRPSGRMPDMQLSHWEALDLASYLLREQKITRPAPRISSRAPEGEVLFRRHGCVQCHDPESAKTDFAKPLADIDHSQSCSAAGFSLSDSQKEQISAALEEANIDPSEEAKIQLTLTKFNCLACHQRGDMGGPGGDRDEYFTTSNLNLGEQARIPPSLDGVGAKLKESWLRKVLISGESVRPYMTTRMPKFGIENIEHLATDFAEADALTKLAFERVKDPKIARESGQKLAGVENLSCVACHTFKGEGATTLNGVELTSMTARLQENWFHHYLRNPQQFHPTTIMPNFWPGGTPVRPELLDGDTGKQIDALWQYLGRGVEARMPSGIKRAPIEYLAGNGEAVMLRRQYRGIGKRGIGVGYPSGINLSFDAGQMRLGSIWRGGFGEMSGVWRGQGAGNVNERSRDVVRFPVAPAFARLESKESDWPTLDEGEKATGFQFLGYSLDEKQRPTFRYTFAGVTISDGFVDTADQLTRTLNFDKPFPSSIYFRASADQERHGLTIELPENADEEIVPLGGKSSLTIKYRFEAK